MTDPYPIEIDVQAVKALREANEPFLLLDVRNPDEYETAQIEGSLLIPMGELGDRLDELDPYKDGRIVVHCHHGGRSMQVTQALRSARLRLSPKHGWRDRCVEPGNRRQRAAILKRISFACRAGAFCRMG